MWLYYSDYGLSSNDISLVADEAGLGSNVKY